MFVAKMSVMLDTPPSLKWWGEWLDCGGLHSTVIHCTLHALMIQIFLPRSQLKFLKRQNKTLVFGGLKRAHKSELS